MSDLKAFDQAVERATVPIVDDIVASYPDDLDTFISPDAPVVAISTHNPLGVTFAAGVYTSIFGSSRQPINSHYARELFARIKASPFRLGFKVIVGGSGGWQITQTNAWEEFAIDCVVDGRSEDRPPETQDHGGSGRQRTGRQQADLARHRRHVHLGAGAHRHAVLLAPS